MTALNVLVMSVVLEAACTPGSHRVLASWEWVGESASFVGPNFRPQIQAVCVTLQYMPFLDQMPVRSTVLGGRYVSLIKYECQSESSWPEHCAELW